MRFNVVAEFIPGKDMIVAHVLSKSPLKYEQLNNITNDVEE